MTQSASRGLTHTLRDLELRTTFHVNALAVSTSGRQGTVARRCNADTLLQAGDILFIKSSSKEAIANLVKGGQVELIDPVAELPSVVHLAELIVLPRSELIGRTVREIDFFRTFGAMVLLVLLFVITSLLSQAISTTATSLLIAPLAMELAARLGISPYPLLMGVALATASAFSTPIASPVNVLVAGAGSYRFLDFLKVGVPLQLLILVATIVIVPLLFPFHPS